MGRLAVVVALSLCFSSIGFAAQATTDIDACPPVLAYEDMLSLGFGSVDRIERAVELIGAMEAVAGEDAPLLAAYGAAVAALGEVLSEHDGSFPVSFAEVEDELLPVISSTGFAALEHEVWQWVRRACGEPVLGCNGFLGQYIRPGTGVSLDLLNPAPDPAPDSWDPGGCPSADPGVTVDSHGLEELPHTGAPSLALALAAIVLLAAGGVAARRGGRHTAPRR